MKDNLSRMLRSGVALLLAFCLVAGVFPTAAFAAEAEINYVSLGDSMTNGYCFTGYNQGSISDNQFKTGDGVYGVDAYPNLFAEWLEEETGKTVNHSKLAVSAMRAEDLNYLLGGREMPTDGWFSQVEDYSGTDGDALKGIYQDAIAGADVITMGIGNASFGAYLVQYFTRMMGVMGGSLDEDEKVDLEAALAVLNPEQKAVIMEAYNQMMALAAGYVPEELGPINVQELIDLMTYVGAGFILNYEGALDQIVALNPDVEIVLVGLMNTTYGMEITGEGFDPIAIGDIMDILFGSLNAYIAALPAAYQAAGKWEDAEFYYADMPNPEFIVQVFDDLYDREWPEDLNGLSGATVRARTIKAYNQALRPMIGDALGFNLPEVDSAAVEAYVFDEVDELGGGEGYQYRITIQFFEQAGQYNGTNAADLPLVAQYIAATNDVYLENAQSNFATVFAAEIEKEISIAIYVALEEALAQSVDTMEITLEGLLGIAGDVLGALGDMPAELNPDNNPAPYVIKTALVNWFTGSDTALAMCKIFALFKVGDGMSVHPTPAAHENIYAAVKAAYKNHTAKDETIKNIEILLDELYDLVETYGPEVAAQVWAQWEEHGYVDAFETSMSELKGMLTARYTYYTETALPAIEVAINALTAEKDNLSAELATLKAALEAKKAELEAAVNGIEIGTVETPDVDIDTGDLGGNEETEVPENDCTVEGEDIEAELEAAIKDLEHAIAVIEALIADIEADIADLIAVAEQIVATVAELEKTMVEVEAAVEDLEAAVLTVIDVIKNSNGVVDQLISSFEAARDTANAAVTVLELTIGTAETMMNDIDVLIEKVCADADAMYNKFMSELPGCIEQIPDEAMLLIGGSVYAAQQAYEANKEAIDAALKAELAALAEEYGISEQAILAELAKLEQEYADAEAALIAELEAIENQIAADVSAKYAEVKADYAAQIEAKKAEAAAKLAELEAEMNGYLAELDALAEDASEEARQQIQAQIDRVTADMETVNEDLACAIEHLENAALIAYEAVSAEVAKAYEEAIAVVNQKLAELEMSYNEAVKVLTAKLAELEAAYNEVIAILSQIDDEIAEKIAEKYAEIEASINAQIEALKEDAAAKLAELEAELKSWMEQLEALGPDAPEEIRQQIQAEIDRVKAEIEAVEQGLEDAIEELEKAAQEAYEQIVAEVNKVYEDQIAALEQKLAELEAAYNEVLAALEQVKAEIKAAYDADIAALEQKLADLKAAYDQAVEDLTAAADKEIAELTEKLENELAKLGQIGEILEGAFGGILDALREELTDAQEAIKEILKGNLESVEDLKDALVNMGGDAIVDAIEALIDVVKALIEEASTADLVIDDSFKYVAIGDGSAATESYVEKLAAALNAEAAENGVDEIDVINNAYVGNTVIAERENLSDVSDADLITIGFSNIEFLNAAINNAMNGVELDWAYIVGAENVHYVEELLAEVALKIDEAGITGEYADMANAVIESYAYSAVLYATELPLLINEINAVNPDALVIIVGMYNPMDDVVIALDENVTMDIGEYIDYLVQGVAVHGLAYSILTGNSIYVDAPAVQTINTDTELGIFDLMRMIMSGFEALYPNAAGDDYIAAEIADALNITYVKSVLYGDVNLDGIVDQSDVALLFAYVLNTESLNEQQLANADVNFDGAVDQSDLTKLFSYVLGQIESL